MKKNQDLEKKSSKPTATVQRQMKPTPRPWRVDAGLGDDPRFYIRSLDHTVIAVLDSHSSIRDEANAELIVRAVNSK